MIKKFTKSISILISSSNNNSITCLFCKKWMVI